MNTNIGSRFVLAPIVAATMATTGGAFAAVDIANMPLFVTAGVDPNVIAGVDNSGSMDSEVLMPTNDGALWWHTTNSSFVGLDGSNAPSVGTLNYNQAGGAIYPQDQLDAVLQAAK